MPAAATSTSTKPQKAAKPAKGAKSKAAPATEANAPAPSSPKPEVLPAADSAPAAAPAGHGKPDQKVYNVEQESIKAEIETLQAQLNTIRGKIDGSGKGGPQNERRIELRKEQDGLREQQARIKDSRTKLINQIKTSQDLIQKKVEFLKTAKAKSAFKTTADIDNRIKALDKQVESGSMKLVDEKRALQEMSNLRRTRRTFEAFQGDEDFIQNEKAKIDELRKQLDDPEQKAISDRYDAIRTELAEIQKEGDEFHASRSKVMEERNALQDKVNALWERKRESSRLFREANNRHWAKAQEERARRDERYRAERAAQEAERVKEITDRLREEAQAPAHQAEIEDCQTLIDYFTIRSNGGTAPPPTTSAEAAAAPAQLAGVQQLEIRKVETDLGDGMIVRKKKGEEEEAYFVGGKKGKKGGAKPKANGTKANGATNGASHAADTKLNLPFGTLTALLSLSIPPPTSTEELPTTIENLKKKKAYFVTIQPRVTQENIAKAEADIKRMENKVKGPATNGVDGKATPDKTADSASTPTTSAVADPHPEVVPPLGAEEKPAEPAATPAVADELSTGVPTEAVDEKLEEVKEDAAAEEAEEAATEEAEEAS